MSSLVTKPAPDFRATAVMPDGAFKEISLSDYRGKKYVVLFFYPLDFTFVCPTEIIAFSDHVSDFEQLNVQLIGCSVDSQFTHLAWRNTPRNRGGLGEIRYPLVSDLKKQISADYGVLIDGGVALRGLFLIDKGGIVRHALVNDLPLGRNVGEVLRTVQALQFSEESGEVCPANWQRGKAGMKADPVGSRDYFEAAYS
jgi:peroxiredoxin (alkyl hydroperoxide reductase subunit C)